MSTVTINFDRIIGVRDTMIYGQFIEHFHRQIYGGFFCPGSRLSNNKGFRIDVLNALRRISPRIIRWPGGCFVSAYHWRDGVGERRTSFDKAWRVEDPNSFGTDEFVELCREIGCEPYICTNAGTGAAEEMSDWVEYCNLPYEGWNAKQRIANGFAKPHKVKFWSIGNENYLSGEIGTKTAEEWAVLVTESAKMMKRVDPSIELSAAALPNANWNVKLLTHAGDYLDWISVHQYWDGVPLANYEQTIAYTNNLDGSIKSIEGILAATGYSGKIRIAFDEWNLRGWYHPNSHGNTLPIDKKLYLTPRDENDKNSSYTMADTVFTACFLNTLLKNCETVRMANFSPTVNTRGLIYAYPEGIVLRGPYHVFDLFINQMGETVVDLWNQATSKIQVTNKAGNLVDVTQLDIVATRTKYDKAAISVVNKDPINTVDLNFKLYGMEASLWSIHTINGKSVDDYNDIDQPDNISISVREFSGEKNALSVQIPPHSVNVLTSL